MTFWIIYAISVIGCGAVAVVLLLSELKEDAVRASYGSNGHTRYIDIILAALLVFTPYLNTTLLALGIAATLIQFASEPIIKKREQQ
jgi:hypothetical protein